MLRDFFIFCKILIYKTLVFEIKDKRNFMSPLEIKNLNIRDKIHLKGRLFYIEKGIYPHE
jgi:hypothetical protein